SGSIAPLVWLDFPRPFAENCNKLVHVTNYEQTLANPANRYRRIGPALRARRGPMAGWANDATAETVALPKTIMQPWFGGARDPDNGGNVAALGGDDLAGDEDD